MDEAQAHGRAQGPHPASSGSNKEPLMVRSSSSRDRSIALQVEALEERCVPSTAEYVTGLYTTLLHRSPDAEEVAGWVDTLNAGASPSEGALAFTTSLAYETNVIRADYHLFLGRATVSIGC